MRFGRMKQCMYVCGGIEREREKVICGSREGSETDILKKES